jgi:hypothetical protein
LWAVCIAMNQDDGAIDFFSMRHQLSDADHGWALSPMPAWLRASGLFQPLG